MRSYLNRLSILFGLFVFVLIACGLSAANHDRVAGQAVPNRCNILMVIDRSGSVSEDPRNLPTLKQGVAGLFAPDGLPSIQDNVLHVPIQLGFWTFSSAIAPSGGTNYDDPYMNYVSVKAANAAAQATTVMNRVDLAGGTDYEQGFGFHGYAYDPSDPAAQLVNPSPDIQSMMGKTTPKVDVLVFMTDGVPNTPSDPGRPGPTGGSDNNPIAIRAAYQAYNRIKAFNPGMETKAVMVGAGTDSAAMDYVINGYGNPDRIDAAARPQSQRQNIVYLKPDSSGSQYGDFRDLMIDIMTEKCGDRNGIVSGPPYSLSPTVTGTTSEDATSGDIKGHLTYQIGSDLPTGTNPAPSSNWSIASVVIPKGQTAGKLSFGQILPDGTQTCGYSARVSYCDNIAGCNQINQIIYGPVVPPSNPTRNCSIAASGNSSFAGHPTILEQVAANVPTDVTLASTYPIGTKLCYILILEQPTRDRGSPLNRASAAYCITVGKSPSVEIHGGDLQVGRFFSTDSSIPAQPAQIDTSLTTRVVSGVSTSYGSWAEYGASAPGVIKNFASASGLAGGYANSPGQGAWSKLTFANAQGQFGTFTAANDPGQRIPDYASTIVASQPAQGGAFPNTLTSGSNASGVYTVSTDVTVNGGTLGKHAGTNKGESIVLFAQNNTVTIAGDIKYDDGPYAGIDQIPQMVIIAKKIIIKPNVTQIDSWLIANDPSDGSITTCDDPGTLTVSRCDQQLIINGPVMARTLNLRRTAGAERASPTMSAEVINLQGSTYLWSQSAGLSEARAQTTLTTEKPPYF
jgi:hypothetical protein